MTGEKYVDVDGIRTRYFKKGCGPLDRTFRQVNGPRSKLRPSRAMGLCLEATRHRQRCRDHRGENAQLEGTL